MNVDTYVNQLIGVDERVRVRFHVKSSSEIEFVGKIPNDDEDPIGCQPIVTPTYRDLQISEAQLLSTFVLNATSSSDTTKSSAQETTDDCTPDSVTQASAPADLDSDSSITRDKAAVSRSMAYYLMERGEYEEARLQLQQIVEYKKEVGPGILLLLAECAAMDGNGDLAYGNFVNAIINIDVPIVDLTIWYTRILPKKYDIGGLLRSCGKILLEYAIIKRTVVENSHDAQYCVGSLRRFLLSLEVMVHQTLFNAGTRKRNISGFFLYLASRYRSDLKDHSDESVVDDAVRDFIVARVHYIMGSVARSLKVTEDAIQTLLKYDAQVTKYNVYGILLRWKANLYILTRNVSDAIPVYQSSIAALEAATDYFAPEDRRHQLQKATKGLEAALACQKLKGLHV